MSPAMLIRLTPKELNMSKRPRIFATTRQITGTPYIHHAYVYEGNRVIRACKHPHGARTHRGAVLAQACADKMLREVLRGR